MNQQISKQCFFLPLSFKISLKDTSFHISLNSLGFCLSRMLVEVSNLYIPTCVGKFFQFMVLTFLENALNPCIFSYPLVYLHFVWFIIFLNVTALQFCKYLSNSVVLSLLTLLCNYGNLALKLVPKLAIWQLLKYFWPIANILKNLG